MTAAVAEDVDYAHTKGAEHNRILKARKLARWLWERSLTYADVLGADEARRRAWARAAHVTPPSTMDTWQAVNAALVAMEGFAEDHPDHPSVARPHADEKATWLGVLEDPHPAPRTWVCDGCMSAVTRSEIHDMADGEHALCVRCVERSTNSPRQAVDGPTAPAAEVVYPRGWDALAALGPIGRADARCKRCGKPAVTFTRVNDAEEWRCADHPPQPGEWGAALDWTPRRAQCGCAAARCYCGRGPNFKLGGGGFRLSDSALLDELAAARGKNRAPVHVRQAAREAVEARKAARKGKA